MNQEDLLIECRKAIEEYNTNTGTPRQEYYYGKVIVLIQAVENYLNEQKEIK